MAAKLTNDLKGKSVVVTGGASGIGWHLVQQLLRNDVATVSVIDVLDISSEVLALNSLYPKQHIACYCMDVTNPKGLLSIYQDIRRERHGLDVVINAAAIFNDNDIETTLLVNLGGIMHSSLIAWSLMSRENGGCGGIICNISSTVGLDPLHLLPIYASSKAGLLHFTRCLANVIYYQRTGVKFICICPGATDTKMFSKLAEKVLPPIIDITSEQLLADVEKHSPNDVAESIVSILQNSTIENGGIYHIDGKHIQRIQMKHYIWKEQ